MITDGDLALGMCRKTKVTSTGTGTIRQALKSRLWQHHHNPPSLHHQILRLLRHQVNRNNLHGHFSLPWKLASTRISSTSKTSPKSMEVQSMLSSSSGSRSSYSARHPPSMAAKVPITNKQLRFTSRRVTLRVPHRTTTTPLPTTVQVVGGQLLVRSKVDG